MSCIFPTNRSSKENTTSKKLQQSFEYGWKMSNDHQKSSFVLVRNLQIKVVYDPSFGFVYSYCRYQKCLSCGMDPELVMTSDETKEMQEKSNGKMTLTKYRERIKKNKDVTNAIELNPEAVQFSDINADAYLNLPSSSSKQTMQSNDRIQFSNPSTISTTQTAPMQSSITIANESETQDNIFDGDSILDDLNQVDCSGELPHNLEDIKESDIILVLTEESEFKLNKI